MAGKGHEDAFPRPRLSARNRLCQATFTGTRGNGRDAPRAVIPFNAVWAHGPARLRPRQLLPNGGWHFWSRRGYGLGYACQRDDRFGRLQRRAAKLNRQLGGEGGSTWGDPPGKPKWMRWRTYHRKYERWKRVVERADEEFTILAGRLLSRPPRRR